MQSLRHSDSDVVELSVSAWFYRNRTIAGFDNPARSLYVSVRELVENSLDACESLSFRVERNESLLTLVETYTSDCAEGNLYPYYISGAIMGIGEGTYTVRVVYNDEYAGTTEQVHESTVTVMAYD